MADILKEINSAGMQVKPKESQKSKIVELFAEKQPSCDPLNAEQLNEHLKTLLNFEKKLDNFKGGDNKCQIARLEDLQSGHKLKISTDAESPKKELGVFRFKKSEG